MQANSRGIKLEPAKLVEIECHCDIGVLFEDLSFIFLSILILIFVFLTVIFSNYFLNFLFINL